MNLLRNSRLAMAALVLAAAGIVLPGCGSKARKNQNILNRYEPSNIKGLDPIMASTLYSHRIVSEIYEGLMQYSYLERPYKAEPQLSDGMPQISEDGLTYTFKIKKGVTFHDDEAFPGGKGREVTAEDFIYSWKRLADIKNQSEGWWVFDGKIVGLNEFRDYTKTISGDAKVDYTRPVEGCRYPDGMPEKEEGAEAAPAPACEKKILGLEAVDKHTLRVQLHRPYPQLLYILTMGFTKVVPREAVAKYGKEFLNNPVGCGPYKLKSWVKNSKLVLVRNPNWRKETYPTKGEPEDKAKGLLADAGKPVPFLDEIHVHIITEAQPRWLKFMQGDLDYAAPDKDNYDSALPGGKLSPTMKKMGIQYHGTPQLDIVYTAFNMEDPVLGAPAGAKGLALRRAICLALDREEFIELMYNGRGIPAKGPIPPGLEGYEPEWENEWATYDPARAKKILAEAFPDGKLPKLAYETTSSSTARQFAEYFKKKYGEVGIEMDINVNTWPELDRKIRTKRGQFWGIAWSADYPDAQNFLQLFYGPNQAPGPNGSNYDDPEFNEIYEKAIVMQPSPERTALYQQLARKVAEDCPWSYELHRKADTLVHGWLKNMKPHDPGHGFFKYYRIDQEMKQRLSAAF